MNIVTGISVYDNFVDALRQCGVQVERTDGVTMPTSAAMHDKGAVVPAVVVSPLSEWGVVQTLKLLTEMELYTKVPVSVKSGGHGYFNGATCSGIMVNLAEMTRRQIIDDVLYLEPGCILGQTIDILARSDKAVPHGDCFGVGAGGHFLTAGWDLILGRKYGLGCQSVLGGRVVLWDGTVLDVTESAYPDVLHAMRGGAAAEVGIVTEIRLQLIDQPPLATWRFTPITRDQLETCIASDFFSKSANLPNEISVSVRFHYEKHLPAPICSLNVVSLLNARDTIATLRSALGGDVAAIVDDLSQWNEGKLRDLRMLPASDVLKAAPDMLAEVTAHKLKAEPALYWNESSMVREMARSYFTSISYWVQPQCEAMLLDLYVAFASAQAHPLRTRMYALVTLGGGRATEMRNRCAMPLGEALARFEQHWDDPKTEESWCRAFTAGIETTLQNYQDVAPFRPYRGDIWLPEQADDPRLTQIRSRYDTRTIPDATPLPRAV